MQSRLRSVLALTMLFLPLIACGDDSAGGGGDLEATCNELCDAQAKGDGCTAATAETCKQGCAFYAAAEGECAEKTQVSLECAKGLAYTCPSGDIAFSTDQKCAAQQSAASQACR